MADDSEIKITIVPDEQANVDAAQTGDIKKTDTVQAEIKDPAMLELMSQYKELETKSAERDAESAERIRKAEEARLAAEREADAARKGQTSSHLDTITTAISASEQEVEGAKSAIRAAKAAGDVDAEIEAQDRLAKARATQLRLDEAKNDIEARIKTPPKREPPKLDAVEAFAQNRTPKTAAWIRSHPEYVQSEKGIRKLTAADAVAQDEGLIPDTPAYFDRVEQYLGLRQAANGESVTKAAPTEASQVPPVKTRSAAPPVAPGASVSSNGGGVPSVTLTAREAAAAQDGTHTWAYDDPKGKFKKGEAIGLNEFARRKMELTRRGAYDRSWTEG